MSIVNTEIGNLIIEGYESDYVYQTINKTHNYYENDILESWKKYIDKSRVIFDVGANIGNHSIFWSVKLKPEIIYSFEPFKPTFERLKSNIYNNNISNVKIVNKGVGEKKGLAIVKSFDETNYGSTALEYNEGINDNETIEIVDLDSFIKENNINSVDFIKIDVEGFEISVLKGMSMLLNNYKPDLWIEVGVDTYKVVFDLLLPLGYVIVDIEGFNVLFLHSSKHSKLDKVNDNKILEKMFYYLSRTNTYYKNYITTKQWLDKKNELLSKKDNEYKLLIDKYNLSVENYTKVKTMHEKQLIEIKALESQISEYKNIEKQLADERNMHKSNLMEYYIDLEKDEKLINELKINIQRLENQNNYLKHENSEYRRKLSLITDTKIGKIGLMLYHKMKKIRLRLK